MLSSEEFSNSQSQPKPRSFIASDLCCRLHHVKQLFKESTKTLNNSNEVLCDKSAFYEDKLFGIVLQLLKGEDGTFTLTAGKVFGILEMGQEWLFSEYSFSEFSGYILFSSPLPQKKTNKKAKTNNNNNSNNKQIVTKQNRAFNVSVIEIFFIRIKLLILMPGHAK